MYSHNSHYNFMKKEEVKKIANLARLELTDKEEKSLGKDISGILDYIDQLREVNTEGVKETAQVTGLSNVLREDKVENWNEAEKESALKQAPLEDGQIKVKRVL